MHLTMELARQSPGHFSHFFVSVALASSFGPAEMCHAQKEENEEMATRTKSNGQTGQTGMRKLQEGIKRRNRMKRMKKRQDQSDFSTWILHGFVLSCVSYSNIPAGKPRGGNDRLKTQT